MIKIKKFGNHEEVLFVEFGHGSVKMTKAKESSSEFDSLVLFTEQPNGNIGETSNEDAGKSTDDLKRPDVVFEFKNPESITALIHTLIEVQKDLFNKQREKI